MKSTYFKEKCTYLFATKLNDLKRSVIISLLFCFEFVFSDAGGMNNVLI